MNKPSPPMHVELVPANAGHLPQLLEWMRELRRIDPMESEKFVPFSLARAAMERLIADASVGRVWLVYANKRPVGYVAITFSFSIELGGQTAFVDEIFIEQSARGKGVGREVLNRVINEARRLGLRNMLLEVSESNKAGIGLYTACGFSPRKYRLMTRFLEDLNPSTMP